MAAEYKLIEAHNNDKPCSHHVAQKLIDIYNDPNWKPDFVAVDKIQYTCEICQSIRIYKILPEKTLL